jgi:hypothetical protein
VHFCGLSVVKCVAKMDDKRTVYGRRKFCRFPNFILGREMSSRWPVGREILRVDDLYL